MTGVLSFYKAYILIFYAYGPLTTSRSHESVLWGESLTCFCDLSLVSDVTDRDIPVVYRKYRHRGTIIARAPHMHMHIWICTAHLETGAAGATRAFTLVDFFFVHDTHVDRDV